MAQSRKVKVNRRSGYDKTFRNPLTGFCGTLIPLAVDEVIPDSKVNMKINVAAALPPLVSDTYMNVRLKVEAFFVPHRLIYGNFEDFFADYPAEIVEMVMAGVPTIGKFSGAYPLIQLRHPSIEGDALLKDKVGLSSLSDYLGYYDASFGGGDAVYANVGLYVCYHLIWQEWYRNPRVQKPAFMPRRANPMFVGDLRPYAMDLPYAKCYFDSGDQPTIALQGSVGSFNDYLYHLADGTNILDLRQRNFDLDYFTSAMNEPQQGEMARVIIGENDGDPANGFTIASLRAQNSIQQFRERNNLTSPRYQQQVYARYGVAPSDGVLQRPALIGAASYDVYSHGISATSSGDDSTGQQDNSNPFRGSLGQRGGNGFASGSDFIISNFHAKEPGYIMVLVSLVPSVMYNQGISRVLQRYIGVGSITDMANGILQNVGPQKIYTKELFTSDTNLEDTFAYADRYADWMIKRDECHGEFRPSGTLSHFVLQRTFAEVPEFGSEFLEIPKDYLDPVLAFTSETMALTYWLDSLIEYKVSMPLEEYSIPSLQDPAYEHGKTITLRKNGQLL